MSKVCSVNSYNFTVDVILTSISIKLTVISYICYSFEVCRVGTDLTSNKYHSQKNWQLVFAQTHSLRRHDNFPHLRQHYNK